MCNEAPLSTIQNCSRRARENELSYLALLHDDNTDSRLNEKEKTKREIKGKRCALEQDTKIVTDIVNLLEDDGDFDCMKSVKVFDFKFCGVKDEADEDKKQIDMVTLYVY